MASAPSGNIVLLSIRPRFANLIMEGVKRAEFRRAAFRSDVSHVVMYVTRPVQKIVGYFEVSGVKEGQPSDLWQRYRNVSGLRRDEFETYYRSAKNGIAIEVGSLFLFKHPIALSALGLGTHPPQSFIYLPQSAFVRIRRKKLVTPTAAE
jgi:predicted transcriptional regulator